jgi:hypothetical protein
MLRESASIFGSGVSRRSVPPGSPAGAGSASFFGGAEAAGAAGAATGSLWGRGGGALADAASRARAAGRAAADFFALPIARFCRGDEGAPSAEAVCVTEAVSFAEIESVAETRSSGRARVRFVGRSGDFLGMRFLTRALASLVPFPT